MDSVIYWAGLGGKSGGNEVGDKVERKGRKQEAVMNGVIIRGDKDQSKELRWVLRAVTSGNSRGGA